MAARSLPTLADVELFSLRVVHDIRGNLTVGEVGAGLPFAPQRYFMVFDVPSAETRGAHAHRTCAQLLIAVSGQVRVAVDDGVGSQEHVLDRRSLALHVPPMIWATQTGYSADAVLLVLASEPYDAAEYVRDHDEFMALRAAARG